MWYNVNWGLLAIQLLPTFLRKATISAFAEALTAPIGTVHSDWKLKRERDFYKLEHTGQVCRLRKVLNDALDVDLRRIYIGDGNSFSRKYIYTRAEQRPTFIGKIFIYQNDEYAGTGADFIVYVPTSIINTKIYELKALIEFYKLASKRYKIQPI